MRFSRALSILAAAFWAVSCSQSAEDLTQYVNPFVGTAYNGHTFPGAACPFGLVQPGPQTGNMSWRYCSGYNCDDASIQGFSQSRLNGTGCHDLGDVFFMPFSTYAAEDYASTFVKENEVAHPGYYSVKLDDNAVQVEITSTSHVAMYRNSYLSDARKLYVDFQCGLVNNQTKFDTRVQECEIAVEDDKTISGHMKVSRWVTRDMYFVMKFDTPSTVDTTWYGAPEHKAPRYVLDFGKGDNPVQIKVALSAVSVEGARKNMEAELSGWNFEAVRKSAVKSWNDILSMIRVQGDKEQKDNVYTALYHLCIQPNNIADVDDAPYYSTLSLWDTFRAAHPFYSLFMPEKNADFVNSMLRQYDNQGFLPIWALWGLETYCMIGNHAVPVIVDAVLRGAQGVDPERAYEAIRRSLTENHRKSSWDIYDQYGYYPFDLVEVESVSRTLESGYDDWCAAQLARKLGKTGDYDFFMKRASYYKNLFDPQTGLPRGKDTKGNWREPFNPFALAHSSKTGGDYTEGNAWQYAWHCMQDVDGLIETMGGSEKFVAKLDSLFFLTVDESVTGVVGDVTGLIGQYAHGNEPSHHVAYFYTMAGHPEKTAEVVRSVFDQFYLDKPDGLCGNDDCGQMSAWYLFSAMGFYPVNTVNQEYILGAPQIPQMEITLPSGKTFTMIAEGLSTENKYVESVTFNGEPLQDRITSDQILSGGTLKFIMTSDK